MSIKQLFVLGVKVLTAAAAGIAVFMGLERAMSKKTPDEDTPPTSSQQSPVSSIDQNVSPETPKIIRHLRSIQETCGKVFCLAQSVSTMADSVFRIFRTNQPEIGFSQNINYSYGTGCTGFTRLSPYVIEAGCNPNAGFYGPNNPKYRF